MRMAERVIDAVHMQPRKAQAYIQLQLNGSATLPALPFDYLFDR